jgi:hypothetical protein
MVIPIVQRKLRSIWAKTSRVVRSGESGMPARHLRRTVLMTDSHSARLMLKCQRKLRSILVSRALNLLSSFSSKTQSAVGSVAPSRGSVAPHIAETRANRPTAV